ncbi:GPW/gp25 family protein [Desulfotruncus alcoholivorax]|uniref:hypothetical protein n=1 Tax=Desulfotruncus alcoholivorax TaxID=265477 RepID=UPI0003F51E44|nr:hypothetical protein [Desulfotruncus alcoholivorax]
MEDLMLDAQGNFVVAADGDAETVTDLDCLIQDAKHLLLTFPGDLWAHEDYGVGLQFFIQTENTELNRLELEQTIKNRLSQDERIKKESISVEISSWDLQRIKITVLFSPTDDAFNDEQDIPQEVAIVLLVSQEGISIEGGSL